MAKIITITIDDNIDSDISDILCWFGGYIEAKGEDWEGRWLCSSLDSLRELNMRIKTAIN